MSVHRCFEAQVALTPNAIAVLHEHGRWSYAELDAQANRLAAMLVELGVGPHAAVGVCLGRSPAMVAVLLGILKTGAAYVPLETTWPRARQTFLLDDAEVRVVVTDTTLAATLPLAGRGVLLLDHDAERIARQPLTRKTETTETTETADTAAPAYIMYTSGSTGEPKGVVVPHRAIIRLVRDVDYVQFGSSAVLLQAAPLAFDASTFEIWGALLNGGAVAIHPEIIPTAHGLGATIARHGVTTAWLTSALFNAVVDDDALQLASLKQLLIGGEALSVVHVRRALAALPHTQLINGYGPTETTTFATTYAIPRDLPANVTAIPIGRAIRETTLSVLDEALRPVAAGQLGELYIGGAGLALGYLKRPQLTAERFIASPITPGERLYKTGDLVRLLPDGNLEFCGRRDQQVKIRGFRVEPGEIETALGVQPGVRACVVAVREGGGREKRLIAYIVWNESPKTGAVNALREALALRLPEHMVPAAFVSLTALPRTANGKVDLQALPDPGSERPEQPHPFVAPTSAQERTLCAVWAEMLGLKQVGILDNFFELGGSSLLALRTVARLRTEHGIDVPVLRMFRNPTVAALAAWLIAPDSKNQSLAIPTPPRDARAPIAIIGMAGRFPGAGDIAALWRVLNEGRDTVSTFTDATLDAQVPEALRRDPRYVPVRGILEDADRFDAAFFGIQPNEAAIMDPQQRILLEVSWEALEDAGYTPESFAGRIGFFAGKYNNSYWSENVVTRPDRIEAIGAFQAMIANEKDYVATRVAHRLDLRGPAISVHTACSTSLVAVVQAMLALRAGQCDLALAGGVSLTVPVRSGYLYQEGGMLSADGHCRPFDATATGTTFGDGAGLVVLKPLAQALADGDQIYAVLRGGAVNNDGADKASFTAPSVAGQAAVIAMAHADAGIAARSISYVEAHGTATPLGDPIEIEALTEAFRATTADRGFCAIGSIKSNLGHTVIAAGVAGLMKTALALQHERIPATVHFTTPNPQIDFATSPFVVAGTAQLWPRSETPRRAGVSAFGVGGTNAHVVVEEAPVSNSAAGPHEAQLLTLSARSAAALDAATQRLRFWLQDHPSANLADVAWTLQVGRKAFPHRRCLVGRSAQLLRPTDAHSVPGIAPAVRFVFPAQDAGCVELGRLLYEQDANVRADLDRCATLFALTSGSPSGAQELLRPSASQAPLALFMVEYALALQWMRWGVVPEAMFGEGVGELVCAVLAGVLPLEQALGLAVSGASFTATETPHIPCVSARLGTWLSVGVNPSAISGDTTERTAAGLRTLLEKQGTLLLEIAPGARLATVARQQTGGASALIVATGEGQVAPIDARTVLLAAAGELWCAGVRLDFTAVHRGVRRQRLSLPTYPFERESFWIARAEPTAQALAVQAPTAQPSAAPVVAVPDRPTMVADIIQILEDASGLELQGADPSATFVEMGLDSLSLTQAAIALGKKFETPISFRQLFNALSTIDRMVAHLESARAAKIAKLSATPQAAPTAAPIKTGSAPTAPITPTAALPEGEGKVAYDAKKAFGAIARIHTHGGEEMTPHQKARFAALTRRYNDRTKGSKKSAQDNRAVLADPRVVTGFRPITKELIYPIVVDRSHGPHLWDVDGNQYVDVLNGFGSNLFGWQPEFITRAVEAQLRRGHEIGPLQPIAGEVAKLFCDMTGQDRAGFCNTGSEAVMGCMRIARTVTGRTTIALFANSYHGIFDEVIVRGTKSLRSLPAAPGIMASSTNNVLVLDYGTPETLRILKERANDLAAILVETVQSRRPDFQPREFLHELRELCTTSGALLIFDEVITGFRTGPGGAQAHFGIQADLASYGKVVGGGFPIGVIAGRRAYMDALDGGFWQYGDDSVPTVGVTYFAGTFVRHPLALAAAKAVLIHLKEQGPALQQQVTGRTVAFADEMNAFFRKVSAPLEIRHFASLWKIFFTAEQSFGELLFTMMRDRGVHIWDGFPCFFTTAHEPTHIAMVMKACQESVLEMQEAGFLAGSLAGSPQAATAQAASTVDAAKSEHQRIIATTESQQELWAAVRMWGDASLAFNESSSLQLSGPLNLSTMQQALQVLVTRHDAMRMTLSADGQQCCIAAQHVEQKVALPCVDLTMLDAAERERRIKELLVREVETPFVLEQGPLFRFQVVREAADLHRFIFTAHHIVCDGWSMGVALSELAEIYRALSKKPETELTAACQFSTYSAELASYHQSAARSEDERWWLAHLAGDLPVLDLPMDHLRPLVKTYVSARTDVRIEAALLARCRKVGASQGASLFATLLTAFDVLLHRLSGQDDVVVAIPFAGQAHSNHHDLIGHCVNTLPVRTLINGGRPFAELLTAVRDALLDATEHQRLGFGALLQKLVLPRDPSRLPLASVLFNLDRTLSGSALDWGDVRGVFTSTPRSYENFDLFVNAVEQNDGGMVLECQYNTDLLSAATVRRWMASYALLLDGLAKDVQTPVERLPMLADADRALLTQWNQTTAEFPRDRLVQHLFEDRNTATPTAIALEYENVQLTYAELNARANVVAERLQALGVGADERVGIYLERSPWMVAAALGVLKAGGAYVPLDPAFPADRLRYMVEDSRMRVVVTQASLRATLPAPEAQAIDIDSLPPTASAIPTCPATPEHCAYVIYTSGSTGKPKGVEVPHRAVVNFLTSMAQHPGMTANDAILAVTTLSFDIAGLELFLPLSVGARIVLAGKNQVADGGALQELITARKVTMMQATPATFRLLLEAGWQGGPAFKTLVGGEAVPLALARDLAARSGGGAFNMYGPTETTIWSTCHRFERDLTHVSIGRPIANTTVHVLDGQMHPVPIGVPGELYIGGAGLARGYLGRPELTNERFLTDASGVRTYRTGDVVRFLPDGTLEYLRRNDTQVKVRGYRIELGEIEAALGAHPAVARAIVVVNEVRPGDVRLVAYSSAKPGQHFTEGELRKLLLNKLPVYMVPQYFVELDEFPLTPNGKIDRKRLPAVQADDIVGETYIAPATANEVRLAALWCSTLRVQRVGLQDNFFNLGGHSLLALSMIAQIEKDFGFKLSPPLLLLNTLAQVAAQLPTPEHAPAQKPVPAISSTTAPATAPAEPPRTSTLFQRMIKNVKDRLS